MPSPSIRSILLADDDRIIHGVLGHFLKEAGYTLRSAFNGRQALEMAEEEPPDLLILDGMMPELDGFEALKLWKSRPHLCHIPVVMLTSRKGEGDMTGALRDGAAGYLTKPFSPDELVAKVKSLTAGGPAVPLQPPHSSSPPPFVAVPNTSNIAAATSSPAIAAPSFAGPRPTAFHGSVRLDETRAGADAAKISDDVIAHLQRLANAEVTVTLVIEAKMPEGAPPHVVQAVTENCRALRFESRRFD